jgi:hypothetical protein
MSITDKTLQWWNRLSAGEKQALKNKYNLKTDKPGINTLAFIFETELFGSGIPLLLPIVTMYAN